MKLKSYIHSPVDYVPREYPLITSGYGWRFNNTQFHDGIDFANPMHNCKDRLNPIGTNVYAIADGNVCFDYDKYDDSRRWADTQNSVGNLIIIKSNIDGKLLNVGYWHILENYVSNGEFVRAGKLIGKYADVGKSYGPHLHLFIGAIDYSKRYDPTPIMFDI